MIKLRISGQQEIKKRENWSFSTKWSEKYQGNAAERGNLKIMLGTERVPDDALNIDQKVDSNDERKQKHQAR